MTILKETILEWDWNSISGTYEPGNWTINNSENKQTHPIYSSNNKKQQLELDMEQQTGSK